MNQHNLIFQELLLFLCGVSCKSIHLVCFFQQYKFVDSQSLLPDDSDGAAATGTGLDDDDDFITTLLPKLTSAPPGPTTQHRKVRDNPSLSGAGGVSTPKRSRVVSRATGSAKRKQTQKSKKSKHAVAIYFP